MSLWKCNACAGSYNDTQRDGSVYQHSCPPSPPNPQGVQVELANKRDENVALDARGRAHDIVSPGAGVTPMQGQPTADPLWIVAMRAQAALAVSVPIPGF